MTSRNMDRTGMPKSGPPIEDGGQVAAAAQAASIPPSPPPTSPSSIGHHGGGGDIPDFLKFARPTEWVELPSRGKYYSSDHPWYNKEQVEIKYMTAKEEDILSSRSLLKKGIAIDRLIRSVCVDNIAVNSLLTGDKNAIMVAARVTGYGPEYPVNLQCQVCTSRSEINWDLEDVNVKTPDKDFLSKHNVEVTPQGYKILLPKTKATVNIRFLNGYDEDNLDKISQNKNKAKLGESRMTDQFRMMIVDINGHADKSLISKFSENMPANDARILRKSYAELKPDIDQEMNFVCPECLSETEVEMPMTAQFFWPD